jgi:hypothetical protein
VALGKFNDLLKGPTALAQTRLYIPVTSPIDDSRDKRIGRALEKA